MTEQQLRDALELLAHRLNLTEPDEETESLLKLEILDAAAEILLYLNCGEWKDLYLPKALEIAAIYYHRDRSEGGGAKSRSYSEGQVSMKEDYLPAAEVRSGVEACLQTLSRYRRVACG